MRNLLIALVLTASAAAGPVQAQSVDGFGRHLADLINRYRQSHGLAPLAISQDLVALAGEHSAAMAAQRYLTHEGFDDRYTRARSRICIENVGRNFQTAEALMDGWRLSPEHHRNLLEAKVARMGIGVDSRSVTFFACL